MSSASFEEYKVRISDAIQKRLHLMPIPGESGFSLVQGFIMQPLSQEVSGNIVIGGQTQIIPLVAVVGNTSGRVYYFAVKALGIEGLNI